MVQYSFKGSRKKHIVIAWKLRKENVKIRGNLSFWKVYKMDKLNRDLLPLEEKRVNECDSVMEMLIPNNIFETKA